MNAEQQLAKPGPELPPVHPQCTIFPRVSIEAMAVAANANSERVQAFSGAVLEVFTQPKEATHTMEGTK